ncbi:type II toxin-antitoxin system HicA family toxin [Frankia sp. Cr2]|uniref:type II toxin-antitoxin system HicA family toxin n=1 Tax=Frankia sp. Cr2 TaxID=3073932 RepID=UPI002AD24FDE|nr:type II toxin-antitoxin system HicA family toxin [Frankia sp. Cr2]
MTPALPRVSGPEVVRALHRAGFDEVATRGSHCKLRHKDAARTVIVPLHRELAVGTLASILRQAGIDAEKLRTLLT